MSCSSMLISFLFIHSIYAIDWSKLTRSAQKMGDVLDNGIDSEMGQNFIKATESLTVLFHQTASVCVLGFIIFCALILWLVLEVRWARLTIRHQIDMVENKKKDK